MELPVNHDSIYDIEAGVWITQFSLWALSCLQHAASMSSLHDFSTCFFQLKSAQMLLTAAMRAMHENTMPVKMTALMSFTESRCS